MAFTQKLLGKGHATARLLLRNGRVYHLFSRMIYRAIDREELRNRREHSVEYIRTKLTILDFVLAHVDYHYLETDAEKVDYFCSKLGISKAFLPAKRYTGAIRRNTTDRYFVDRFPLFFAPESSSPAVVTFSFVDPGLLSLASFDTHLLAYSTLFSALPTIRIVYVATRTTHYKAAETLFLSRMHRTPNSDPGEEVLRYFSLRKLWEAKRFGSLTYDDTKFLTAEDWGYITHNPALKTKLPRRPILGSPKPILTPEQVTELRGQLKEPARSIVTLLVLTGLRIGELLALRWKCVDLRACTLRVAETVYDGHFDTPKSKRSARLIPLCGEASATLARNQTSNVQPEELVFHIDAGQPLNRHNLLRRQLRPACKKLGLHGITWHSMRHSHATLLDATGAPLGTVQSLLGHSTSEITREVYLHAIPDDQRRAVKRFYLDPNGLK